jgi:hypothetical protein
MTDKSKKSKPIGEELATARDQLWQPKLEPTRTPMTDMVVPSDQKPNPNPAGKPITVIITLTEEMRQAYGDDVAEVYQKALLREAGLKKDNRRKKDGDEE